MSHLTYFKVKNFKCFDEIEVKDIGQFNLIVGDNNVGKTALMEAMMVDEDPWKTLGNYYHLLADRGILNRSQIVWPFFHLIAKDEASSFSFQCSTFKWMYHSYDQGESFVQVPDIEDYDSTFSINREDSITEQHKRRYDEPESSNSKFSIHEESDLVVESKHFSHINYLNSFYGESLPFIGIKTLNGKELGLLFTKAWKNDLDILENIIKGMKSLIPNIKDIRIGEKDLLCVSIAGEKKLKPLGSLGFGSNRFVEILIGLFRFQNQRLFIDEIDTGIHHSRLPEFLKTILTLAKELNVQLFMTTHSKECEEAFVKVLAEQKEQADAFRCISLFRDKSGKIANTVRNFDQYEGSLSRGFELRGR